MVERIWKVDFLKKLEPSFVEKDSENLIEGISEKRKHFLNGKEVDIKDMSLGEIIKTEVKGISGYHRFDEAFRPHFAKKDFDGKKPIEEILNIAYELGQNGLGEINGNDESVFSTYGKVRSVSVGDVFVIRKYVKDGMQEGNMRRFLVSCVGFREFDRDGNFL